MNILSSTCGKHIIETTMHFLVNNIFNNGIQLFHYMPPGQHCDCCIYDTHKYERPNTITSNRAYTCKCLFSMDINLWNSLNKLATARIAYQCYVAIFSQQQLYIYTYISTVYIYIYTRTCTRISARAQDAYAYQHYLIGIGSYVGRNAVKLSVYLDRYQKLDEKVCINRQ